MLKIHIIRNLKFTVFIFFLFCNINVQAEACACHECTLGGCIGNCQTHVCEYESLFGPGPRGYRCTSCSVYTPPPPPSASPPPPSVSPPPTDCGAGYTGAAGNCRLCAEGKKKEGTGSAACVECAAGKKSATSRIQCDDCDSGKYSARGAHTCTACGPGRIWDELTNDCDDCKQSTYTNGGKKICDDCPIGKSSNTNSNNDDIDTCLCKGDTSGKGEEDCESCPSNSYSIDFKSDCEICGDFQTTNTDKTECVCQIGYEKINGICNACDDGKYSALGNIPCEQCTKDHEFADNLIGKCSSCPVNTVTDVISSSINDCKCIGGYEKILYPNSNTCNDLPFSDGTEWELSPDFHKCKDFEYSESIDSNEENFCTKHGDTDFGNGLANYYCCVCGGGIRTNYKCTACVPGTYSQEQTCVDCEPGTFSMAIAASEPDVCEPCIIGTYGRPISQNEFRSSCIICETGKYQNEAGQTICKECNANQITAQIGSTMSSDCEYCTTGRYKVSNSECVLCPSGKYMANNEHIECTNCEEGKYSLSDGSTKCELCDHGQYPISDATKCDDCETGKYQDTAGEQCQACAVGKVTLITPATSEGMCSDCLAGKFSAVGTVICLECDSGKYKKNPGTEECTSCPSNTQERADKTACVCNAGYDTNGDDNNIAEEGGCTACVNGKYKSSEINICSKCPEYLVPIYEPETNDHLKDIGATECKFCEYGYVWDDDEAKENEIFFFPKCTICDPGLFHNNLKNELALKSQCQKCSAVENSTEYCDRRQQIFEKEFSITQAETLPIKACELKLVELTKKLEIERDVKLCVGCSCGPSFDAITFPAHINCTDTTGAGRMYLSRENHNCTYCPISYENRNNYCNKMAIIPFTNNQVWNTRQNVLECTPGYQSSMYESIQCVKCAIGKYKSSVGNHLCKNCPNNSITKNNGSYALEDCMYCAQNHYLQINNITGEIYCTHCHKCDTIRSISHQEKTCTTCEMIDFGNSGNNCQLMDVKECKNYLLIDDLKNHIHNLCGAQGTNYLTEYSNYFAEEPNDAGQYEICEARLLEMKSNIMSNAQYAMPFIYFDLNVYAWMYPVVHDTYDYRFTAYYQGDFDIRGTEAQWQEFHSFILWLGIEDTVNRELVDKSYEFGQSALSEYMMSSPGEVDMEKIKQYYFNDKKDLNAQMWSVAITKRIKKYYDLVIQNEKYMKGNVNSRKTTIIHIDQVVDLHVSTTIRIMCTQQANFNIKINEINIFWGWMDSQEQECVQQKVYGVIDSRSEITFTHDLPYYTFDLNVQTDVILDKTLIRICDITFDVISVTTPNLDINSNFLTNHIFEISHGKVSLLNASVSLEKYGNGIPYACDIDKYNSGDAMLIRTVTDFEELHTNTKNEMCTGIDYSVPAFK